MNITHLLIDLDGVILEKADHFSNRCKKLYPEANHDAILEFFTRGAYDDVETGKKDLVAALEEVIGAWRVPVTIEQLLVDWFSAENNLNMDVIDLIQDLRRGGLRCIVATNHSHYRKNILLEDLQFDKYFDGIITSADVAATKNNKLFFKNAVKMLGARRPQELGFIDHDEKNVGTARYVGLHGFVYRDIHSFREMLTA